MEMVSAWKRCLLHLNGHPGPPRLHGRPDICLNVGWVKGFFFFSALTPPRNIYREFLVNRIQERGGGRGGHMLYVI